MRKYSYWAFVSILIGCSTSKISVKKDAIKQIKSIAVMPFTSAIADADADVTRECSEAFKGSLISAGLKVVERERIDKILQEKQLVMTGLIDNKAIETSQFLGADATMLGEITEYKVKSVEVVSELPEDGPGKYDARNNKGDGVYVQRNKKWFKKDKRDTFQFQVVVRLISNVTSETVLTIQNQYPVQTYGADRPGVRPANLDEYRSFVLTQMSKDLEKALTEALKP